MRNDDSLKWRHKYWRDDRSFLIMESCDSRIPGLSEEQSKREAVIGFYARKNCPHPLRRIVVWDTEKVKTFVGTTKNALYIQIWTPMKKHRVKEKISLSINLGARPQPHPLHVVEGGLPSGNHMGSLNQGRTKMTRALLCYTAHPLFAPTGIQGGDQASIGGQVTI